MRLGESLKRTYEARFVGRRAELELIDAALTADGFRMIHVFAPGGVGKTTLLRAAARQALERGISVSMVDGRVLDESAEGFEHAIARQLGAAPGDDIALAMDADRHLILIDSFERIRPLEPWLRDVFFPRLSENVVIVTAGRERLTDEWRTDLRWADALRCLPLRDLTPSEARALLQARGVDDERHDAILAFAHGHALALTLVCEALSQRPDVDFAPDEATDVVHRLVDRFTRDIRSPARRQALEAAALVRVTTESVLRALLNEDDVFALFEWLRSLSFMEHGPDGLLPHDVVRNAIVADLRWRDPDRFNELRDRAHKFYWDKRSAASDDDHHTQVALLYDLSFLHSTNAIVGQFFAWRARELLFSEQPKPSDWAEITQLIERHEGPESAKLGRSWFDRQPTCAQVFRDRRLALAGYHGWVQLTAEDEAEVQNDPATAAAWRVMLARGPLRGAECALITRFWVPRDGYQSVSVLGSLMFLHTVHRYFTTAKLAYSFAYFAQPEFWSPVFTYMGFERVEEADYELDGKRFGVFLHDWRSRPPSRWIELLMQRETIAAPVPPDPTPQRSVVLDRESFSNAVKDALILYATPERLAGNPLLQSKLVRERSPGDSRPEAVLVKLIKRANDATEERFARVVGRTYLNPARTQELAAESLELAFSTYRRHLKRGIEAIVEHLWQLEIGEA